MMGMSMRGHKSRELCKILSVNPEAVVVKAVFDHRYRCVKGRLTTAMLKDGEYSEDYGERYTPEGDEHGKRVPVVVLE